MRIDGLNTRQVEICDQLWACDTMIEIEKYLDTLSTKEQQQAKTLIILIALQYQDQEVEEMTSYPDAERLFSRLTDN